VAEKLLTNCNLVGKP